MAEGNSPQRETPNKIITLTYNNDKNTINTPKEDDKLILKPDSIVVEHIPEYMAKAARMKERRNLLSQIR